MKYVIAVLALLLRHYPELKAYGYNREQVINASVEFDVNTLSPTYKLLIGVPGRSNAFEISKRLGLSDRVIDRARNHISTDTNKIENMIAKLEESQKMQSVTGTKQKHFASNLKNCTANYNVKSLNLTKSVMNDY